MSLCYMLCENIKKKKYLYAFKRWGSKKKIFVAAFQFFSRAEITFVSLRFHAQEIWNLIHHDNFWKSPKQMQMRELWKRFQIFKMTMKIICISFKKAKELFIFIFKKGCKNLGQNINTLIMWLMVLFQFSMYGCEFICRMS